MASERCSTDKDVLRDTWSLARACDGTCCERLGWTKVDRENRSGQRSPRQTTDLLEALLNRERTASSGGGARIRLHMGANAVLFKMDAFQDRIDTPPSLIRKGHKTGAAVLPALPRPVIHSLHLAPGLAALALSAS